MAKTLKNMKTYYPSIDEIFVADKVIGTLELKDELKKWIEEIEIGHCTFEKPYFCPVCKEFSEKEGIQEWDCGCEEAIVNFIRYVFNIEKEAEKK